MIDFNTFKVITFDCYGTLIDWESGILTAIKPILLRYDVSIDDNKILELYAKIESNIQKHVYKRYRYILREVIEEFGKSYKFTPSESELLCLENSLKNWLPFPDTVEALKVLKDKFKIGIISNTDNDLFVYTANLLQIPFDYVITAEDVKSYKPSLDNFKMAIDQISVGKKRILHVAQSIYHDIIPAKEMGLTTVWINRRHAIGGFGVTLPATSEAEMKLHDLKSLADKMSESNCGRKIHS